MKAEPGFRLGRDGRKGGTWSVATGLVKEAVMLKLFDRLNC